MRQEYVSKADLYTIERIPSEFLLWDFGIRKLNMDWRN